MRRIWLYTSAIDSSLPSPDQTRQFEQILNAECCAAGGHHIERILGHRTGPLGW
jgi:hypothetical protein